jgi:hypothetical protein
MAKQIILTQNDFGILIRVTVDFGDPTITLEGKTMNVEIVPPDGVKYTPSLQPQIIDTVNRVVDFLITEEDTLQVGLYSIYFYMTTETSKLTAQNPVTYYVKSEDGGAE